MILKFTLLLLLLITNSFAGRPLYTDDVGILSKNQVQLETWIYSDKRSLQHWIEPTFGITDSLEMSITGVHGQSFVQNQQDVYSVYGPILEAKTLILNPKDNGTPGLAFAGGAIPPYGRGVFKSPTWEYFFYFATTSYIAGTDKWLVHLNLGGQTLRQLHKKNWASLWGAAVELKTGSQTHCFVESTNGEIYGFFPGVIAQTGLRYDVTSHFQLDGSIGRGLSGNPLLPFWATLGLRIATE